MFQDCFFVSRCRRLVDSQIRQAIPRETRSTSGRVGRNKGYRMMLSTLIATAIPFAFIVLVVGWLALVGRGEFHDRRGMMALKRKDQRFQNLL
jgi:hypothetical protein